CEPFEITWTAGTAPYTVAVDDPPSSPNSLGELVTIADNVVGTSFTWIVAFDAGTSLQFTVEDAIGVGNASDPFTVAPGTGNSCFQIFVSASQSPTSHAVSRT
ncbi:hypothetical protein FB45DRAFT_703155, partial [Roridomyces roridus]